MIRCATPIVVLLGACARHAPPDTKDSDPPVAESDETDAPIDSTVPGDTEVEITCEVSSVPRPFRDLEKLWAGLGQGGNVALRLWRGDVGASVELVVASYHSKNDPAAQGFGVLPLTDRPTRVAAVEPRFVLDSAGPFEGHQNSRFGIYFRSDAPRWWLHYIDHTDRDRTVYAGFTHDHTGSVSPLDADALVVLPPVSVTSLVTGAWLLDVSGDGKEDWISSYALEPDLSTPKLRINFGPFDNGSFDLDVFDATISGASDYTRAASADVTGDGFDDLVLTATTDGPDSIHVFPGPVVGDLRQEDVVTVIHANNVATPSMLFGANLLTGDFDGDGALDLVVSAARAQSSVGTESGLVFVFRGPLPAGELSTEDAWATLQGSEPFARFGYTVSVHDLDGDSRDELVVWERGDVASADFDYRCDTGIGPEPEHTGIVFDTGGWGCGRFRDGLLGYWNTVPAGVSDIASATMQWTIPTFIGNETVWAQDIGDVDEDGIGELAIVNNEEGTVRLASPCERRPVSADTLPD